MYSVYFVYKYEHKDPCNTKHMHSSVVCGIVVVRLLLLVLLCSAYTEYKDEIIVGTIDSLDSEH